MFIMRIRYIWFLYKYIWSKTLSSSLNAMLKLTKTTSKKSLFPSDCTVQDMRKYLAVDELSLFRLLPADEFGVCPSSPLAGHSLEQSDQESCFNP